MISIENYPRLEFFIHSSAEELIDKSYRHVEKLPICWVAHEEMELEYGKALSEHGVEIEMNEGQLLYKDKLSDTVVARILFSKKLVEMDLRITA
ncbi:hypothetical protein [Fulvivirga ligni]|uniref:hypothetical protein n=1 Tax=Fulvivirga ligni TaxID=2904246 RepID=UPI001F41F1E4|nr:hypothetical protein [Fulvivirga ligni]UII23313.1 hypothetical protein LVD16_08740 [Fulvivirga ligni]